MNTINVLIVDDDENDRYIARRQLAKNDRIGAVVEADDGEMAYELFQTGRFTSQCGPHPPRTLILLDINMPRMSGFELLEQLEASDVISPSDVSVIAMLTSSTYFGDRERSGAFDLVDGYIEKPLTPAKITDLLDRFWEDDQTADAPPR